MTSSVMAVPPGRGWLGLEFLLFYVGIPVAVALFLPPSALFPVLFAATFVGLVLLHLTAGFGWYDLMRGWSRIDWRAVAGFAALTLAAATAVVLVTAPGAVLGLLRANPTLMVMVLLLYPLLSALPQEIVFRPLFFRRYGPLLAAAGLGLRPSLVLNAAVFSLAHLMFWNWIVAAMTFAGGLAFAWAYEARRNFPMAVLLHAVGGNILFLMGLGIYFYSGNITRPF